MVDDAIADTVMFLMLGALRNFNASMVALRKCQWRGSPSPVVGHDPSGKVLGILGMRGIGKNISKEAAAFGMTTLHLNRNRFDEKKAVGATYVSFEYLLKNSNVLSLNLPLTPRTKHIMSTNQFKMMKPNCIIIKTASRPVLDEAALVQALIEGVIGGAGVDVYEEEPKIHPGLLENERVILLPHMGTWTYETQTKMEIFVVHNICDGLTTRKLGAIIPEQAGLQYRMRNQNDKR